MPALIAVINGNADPLRRELAEVNRMAKGVGPNLERGLNSGVMRELVVLGREISSGNWSRIPGSLSILLSRMGLLKYVFSAVGGVIVAAGVATYYFWQHLKKVNEELDNTGNLFERSFGRMADSLAKARKEAAMASADFSEWMNKEGESHDTLATKVERRIKLMREETALKREASKDKSKSSELKSEQDERDAELKILNDAINEQTGIVKLSLEAAQKAEFEANQSPDAVARNATIGDNRNKVSDLDEEIKKFTSIQKSLAAQIETAIAPRRGVVQDYLLKSEENQRAAASTSVTIDGKTYQMSLNDATAHLDKQTKYRETLAAEEIRLAQVQRQLADSLKDAKAKTDREIAAQTELTKERNDLIAQIGMHQQYDPAISEGSTRSAHGSVNSLQQIGAYAAPAVQIDIARRSERHLKTIADNTSRVGGSSGARSLERSNF